MFEEQCTKDNVTSDVIVSKNVNDWARNSTMPGMHLPCTVDASKLFQSRTYNFARGGLRSQMFVLLFRLFSNFISRLSEFRDQLSN